MISKFFLVSLLAILICPLLILYSKFGWSTDFSIETYLSAFLNSFIQASVTSIFCIGLSFILVPSLSHLDFVKVNRVLKLAQLPLLLPSLITFLIIFSYFDKFPFGNIGVILTFIIIFHFFKNTVMYIFHFLNQMVFWFSKLFF
jgi:ABC-type Fe3+ transport system permease subunit